MDDDKAMARATELAWSARASSSPNPWVGCVVVSGADVYEGATEPPGGPHAEVVALSRAGGGARGATLYTTLEPCGHEGRTGPCVDAILSARVARVVVAIEDPDEKVTGRGLAALRRAGVEVTLGVGEDAVREQLAPYLKHRSTGRPWVVLKLAATLDGRTAAPDGRSRWITGEEARSDAHRLRAESDAVLVGAGTVRADDPRLTARTGCPARQPLRVVLGRAPAAARVRPALELEGELGPILDELGSRGVVQLLVEGGAHVAGSFHREGLVDRYVFYLAPALFGGDDAQPLLAGPAVAIDDIWRGRIVALSRLGDDIRVDLAGR